MRNLTRDKDCDTYILEELDKSGIDIYSIGVSEETGYEVPFTIVGGLGGIPLTESDRQFMDRNGFNIETIKNICSFTFIRYWYYWVVYGFVPLIIAEEIYGNPNGKKDIRANGHCGAPPPSEQLVRHKVCGMDVVNNYHIDSQEGLNYFVTILKERNLI